MEMWVEKERDPSLNRPMGGTDTGVGKSGAHLSKGRVLAKLPWRSWNNSVRNDTEAPGWAEGLFGNTRWPLAQPESTF